MAKSKHKRTPKTVLKLPDLEQSKSAVMNSLTSASSKRSYDHAIREFIDLYCSELTAEEGKKLLGAESADTLRSRRNRALLSLLIGCGLRRAEVTTLRFEDLQLREGRWVIADLRGKGGHIRTIPVPEWVKETVDSWSLRAGINAGPLLRSINKAGRIWGHGFTPKVIWAIVKANAKSCGLPSVAPHDLRRTCARLCHQAGGELDQIQFLLGHVSIQTTERYLGCKQRFRDAVNDHIGLEPEAPS